MKFPPVGRNMNYASGGKERQTFYSHKIKIQRTQIETGKNKQNFVTDFVVRTITFKYI
jgi:hypothetical protein